MSVVVLVVVGILLAVVAIEYYVEPIHSLPSYFPGAKHIYGHYHKRAALAGVLAFVAFVAAGILAVRFTRAPAAPPTPAANSASDILAGQDPKPEA